MLTNEHVTRAIRMRNKQTGELDEAEIEARTHITNYQARAQWRGIFKVAYGDSIEAAIQNVLEVFSKIPAVSEYDIEIMP